MKYLLADLFCGAGGTSTGAARAITQLDGEIDLVAVNHWEIAIQTHTLNHPKARHFCVNLDAARPEDLVPEGRLDLLMASPECTHHSRARGGKPVNDQRRMSAWHVNRWCAALNVNAILVENVAEFMDWGPVLDNGVPDPLQKGIYFQSWIQSLWGMGYAVDFRVLNAADYGEATTRSRLFIQARKDGLPIKWPEPSHSKSGSADMFGGRQKWRPAREVIDWQDPGKSLLGRTRPLSLKTRLRIARGLHKFGGQLGPHYVRLLDLPDELERDFLTPAGGLETQPFVVGLRENNVPKTIDGPIPTATCATGGGIALVEPYVLGQHGGGVARPVGLPMPTITTDGAISLVDPLLSPYYGNGECSSVERPVPTIPTIAKFGLAEPMIVAYGPKMEARPVAVPLPTIMTKDRLGLCEPFLVPGFGEKEGQLPRLHSIAEPLPTVTANGHTHLVEPVREPARGAVDPKRMVEINGQPYLLDIRFRMLRPAELGRAMGFDAGGGYDFVGTTAEVTKQIGNAVSVRLATALVLSILGA